MTSPFKPGTVYYADVKEHEVRQNETRNNPEKGPRPWLIIYSRQHARTGTVLAAPLYTKGDREIASHYAVEPDHFAIAEGQSALLSAGYIHLEQLRALDKERLDVSHGALGTMKPGQLSRVRGALYGMFDPRHLPQ